jgi:hypothetical protein
MLLIPDQVGQVQVGRIQDGLTGCQPLLDFLLFFQLYFLCQVTGIENGAADNADTQQGKEPAPVETESFLRCWPPLIPILR